jgi:hypothetical protein
VPAGASRHRAPAAFSNGTARLGRQLPQVNSVTEVFMASAKQKSTVEKVMHEDKNGTLKSGSGRKVKSRKQAVAIAMSESGQSKKRKKAS